MRTKVYESDAAVAVGAQGRVLWDHIDAAPLLPEHRVEVDEHGAVVVLVLGQVELVGRADSVTTLLSAARWAKFEFRGRSMSNDLQTAKKGRGRSVRS